MPRGPWGPGRGAAERLEALAPQDAPDLRHAVEGAGADVAGAGGEGGAADEVPVAVPGRKLRRATRNLE